MKRNTRHFAIPTLMTAGVLGLGSLAWFVGTDEKINRAPQSVINGIATQEYPQVVDIRIGKGIGTAVFLTPRKILTAAHGFCDQSLNDVKIQGILLQKVQIKIHPGYQCHGGVETGAAHDLALLLLPEDMGPKSEWDRPSPQLTLAVNMPRPGDRVTLIGYGHDSYDPLTKSYRGVGIRRIGYGSIHSLGPSIQLEASFEPARSFWKFKSKSENNDATTQIHESALAGGDSGGPLISENGEILGVASGIRRVSNGQVTSFYSPVYESSNHEFITEEFSNHTSEVGPLLLPPSDHSE